MHKFRPIDVLVSYIDTPSLWEGAFSGIVQFELGMPSSFQDFSFNIKGKFGHKVEFILKYIIMQNEDTDVLATNLQINTSDRTLGEIDFIVEKNESIYHLETAFKFYLYDPNLITRERFPKLIGPNGRDSFQSKIDHLLHQQFPVLKLPETLRVLRQLKIETSSILQQTIFKAQIFMPHFEDIPTNAIEPLNARAISGTYFHFSALHYFADSKFVHIEDKLSWMISPHTNVEWKEMHVFKNTIKELLDAEQSVYVWRKTKSGDLFRHFIVWW